MTMPTAPEDLISIAELARTMKDFRDEFRGALNGMVRIDVYRAEQATLRAETAAQNASLIGRLITLERDLKQVQDERRQYRTMSIGAALTAAVTVVLSLLNLK